MNSRGSFLANFCKGWVQGALVVAAVLVALILTACASPIPPPPQVVKVAVPTPCVTSVPPRPAISEDSALALMDDYKFTLSIFADRRALLDYSAELEAVLSACQ